jgi:magnesium chelatase family protein
VSGPLLDRIDLVVPVPVPTDEDLTGDAGSESTATVAARVARARDRALARQGMANAQLPAAQLLAPARVAPAAIGLLRAASVHLGLSARGFHRVLRIARTIADLAHADTVIETHVAEAVQWRRCLPRDGSPDGPTAA